MTNTEIGTTPSSFDKPVNWQLALLCLALGSVCLAFPYLGDWINPNVSSPVVYRFSFSAAFGLFLTAVGGWASGNWKGWTFGGAAATVVALFLLMQFFTNGQQPKNSAALVAKIDSPSLYTQISAVEVMQENGARLFVAPNRKLNHADVLIEKANLDTDCLAFIFAPKPNSGEPDGETETIDLKVPSKFFLQTLKQAPNKSGSRKRLRLFYHHASRTILRGAPTAGAQPEPLTGPGICSRNSSLSPRKASNTAAIFNWISKAAAADQSSRALIEQLISTDSLTRRDAREQIAQRGPETVPELFKAIPDKTSPTHYRFALGAATALAKMASTDAERAAVRDALTEEDLETLVSLVAHPDKTLQKWATRAVIGIQDSRSVTPLMGILADQNVTGDGKYNAALALRDTAPTYPKTVQQNIVKLLPPLKPKLDARAAKLLEQLPSASTTIAKTGWVYIGVRIGDEWNEVLFNWPDNEKTLPSAGSSIEATGDINLRSDPIQFNLNQGWVNSPIIGLVRKNQAVKLLRVKEVTKGFFWAEVELI